MSKIKVMICDDMSFVIQCFSIILNQTDDIELIAAVTSGDELLAQLANNMVPDVLLLDIQMDYASEGIDILEKTKKLYPDMKVIMLSVHEENDYIAKCFSLGASDYIIKSDDFSMVVDTIRNAYNNKISLNPYVSKIIIDSYKNVQEQQSKTLSLLHCIALLTVSEYKILQLLYKGYSYNDIAKMRFVEGSTIRSQANKILKKFNKKRMRDLINELQNINFFDFKMPL